MQINLLQYENVNDMYNEFHVKYLEIININAPYKTLSKKRKQTKTETMGSQKALFNQSK